MLRFNLRTQLTLLYAIPFFASGAVLLAVPLLGVKDTAPGPGNGGPGQGPPATPDVGMHGGFGVYGISLAAMLVVSFVLGWLVAGRFLRPLRTITTTARDISASNLDRRLRLTGRRDEFRDLADTLDDLFARLQAAFESQRHFVANASHELRTPLTAERTLLQVALADPDADVESLRSACGEVLALGESQERLISALLTLASSERGIDRRERFDLAGVADSAVLAREDEARRGGVRVTRSLAAAPVAGDPSLVERMVANLVDNAVRHNSPGGWVEVATGGTGVTVENSGPVIPPGEVERLFEPFQQLGGERIGRPGGHGLGLAIVRAIVHAHGAALHAQARPEGGLRVEVAFR